MIDVYNAQIDFLKNMRKYGTKRYVKPIISKEGFGNGSYFLFIPDLFLDVSAICFRLGLSCFDSNKLKLDPYDSRLDDCYLSDEIRVWQGIRHVIFDCDNAYIYVNNAFLKYSDLEKCHFKYEKDRGEVSPVYQFNAPLDTLEAIYMPVIIRG